MVARTQTSPDLSASRMAHPMKPLLTPVNEVEELGIPRSMVTDLFFRLLFQEREVSVARFSEVLAVTPRLADQLLAKLKQDNMIEVARTGGLNSLSYIYRLTDAGESQARDALERSQYVGPVPINIETYNESVEIQYTNISRITPDRVQKALVPSHFAPQL